MKKVKLYLASTSPRRKELLKTLAMDFACLAPNVDETPWPNEVPESFALRMAWDKAHWADAEIGGDACIIAADTIVVLDGNILGKPRNEAHAAKMLKSLSGCWHKVMTGLCVIQKTKAAWWARGRVERSDVLMKKLLDEDIKNYIASGEPMDKAGAYAVQGATKVVEEFKGSYTNIMGLPMEALTDLLKSFTV